MGSWALCSDCRAWVGLTGYTLACVMGRGAHTSWPYTQWNTKHEHTSAEIYFATDRRMKREDTEIISNIRLNMINNCSLMLAQACKYGLWSWADLWSQQSAKVKQCPWKSNNNWQGNKWWDRGTYSHNIRLHYRRAAVWKLFPAFGCIWIWPG